MNTRCQFLLALAFGVAGITPAFAQDTIYSLNVLGFQKHEIPNGSFAMVANPFDREGNELNTVLDGQMTGSGFVGIADKVFIWDPVTSSYITVFKNGDGDWVYATNRTQLADIPLNPGLGFWLENSQAEGSTQTLVTVGNVISATNQSISVLPGFQILSYSYSAEVGLNQCGLTNGFGAPFFGTADKIYAFDTQSQTYDTYFLKDDKKWYSAQDMLNPAVVNLHPGQAFWYEHKGTGYEWIETKPYSSP